MGKQSKLDEPLHNGGSFPFINVRCKAQWRPCRLEAAPLKTVADWTQSYRRFWEASFDALGEYLEELQSGSPAAKQPAKQESTQDFKGRRRKPRS